jgi:signal transduction histidine kinase
MVARTLDEVRQLIRALRPIYLEELGLVPALEMLARETGQGMGISIEFQRLGTERRLDATIELALYRMAQEALSNIARHARATRASLIISFSPTEVGLQVTDNGAGFKLPENPSEYAMHGHYGLLGLHERAELINAAMEIHTAPGEGTRVNVTLRV